MSIINPAKVPGAIPGTENGNETPVQPQVMPTIPGSPPGTTYGHENDETHRANERDPSGATVDPANREPKDPPHRVTPEAPVVAPAKGK